MAIPALAGMASLGAKALRLAPLLREVRPRPERLLGHPASLLAPVGFPPVVVRRLYLDPRGQPAGLVAPLLVAGAVPVLAALLVGGGPLLASSGVLLAGHGVRLLHCTR